MDFGLSQEISKSVLKKASILTNISKSLENNFLNKNYGNGIVSLTIGIICVEPKADSFFKIRKKYTKSKKMLEYDIKLDFEAYKLADKITIENMVASAIIDSLHTIEEMNISNFNLLNFKNDLETFFHTRIKELSH